MEPFSADNRDIVCGKARRSTYSIYSSYPNLSLLFHYFRCLSLHELSRFHTYSWSPLVAEIWESFRFFMIIRKASGVILTMIEFPVPRATLVSFTPGLPLSPRILASLSWAGSFRLFCYFRPCRGEFAFEVRVC